MSDYEWKLVEPQVYLKPVEQTLYSAAVPIKKKKWNLHMVCILDTSRHLIYRFSTVPLSFVSVETPA